MKIILFGAILLSPFVLQANTQSQIKFGSFYETNTFYAADEKEADVAFLINPTVVYETESQRKYKFSTHSNFSYTKYLSNANQDFFDYDMELRNTYRFSRKFQAHLTPVAKLLSEPALARTEKRLERQFIGLATGFAFHKDPRRQYIFEALYEQESMSQKDYQFLENQTVQASLYYKKYFLPETFVYVGLRGEMRTFPDGKKSPVNRHKFDSQRFEPGFGLEGRLTRYFKIRSYFGYGLIQYAEDINYRDPVYLLELEEEVSPKDFLLIGLSNLVSDSYFTNFQSDQKVYVGYGRFLGDRMLWVTKAEYLYKTYSRPRRRDDQRFVMDTRLEFSYTSALKIEATLMFDVVTSDAVDQSVVDHTPIDPIASYQNVKLGIFGKYLF